MITEPHKSVALTFEQLQQIEIAKETLNNLANETEIASRNLVVVKKDVEKAAKERIYQEELLADLGKSLADKQASHEALKQQLSDTANTLSKHQDEIVYINKKHADKASELDARETAISKSEEEIATRLNALKIEENRQKEERVKLDTALKSFSEATKTVVW